MSVPLLVLAALGLGAVLALAAVGAYARLRVRRGAALRRAALDERVIRSEGPVVVTEEDASIEELEARVVDPDNPPTWRTFQPRQAGRLVVCTCHGQPIAVGDNVLMWPIKGHPDGAMDLFCELTVRRPSDA